MKIKMNCLQTWTHKIGYFWHHQIPYKIFTEVVKSPKT